MSTWDEQLVEALEARDKEDFEKAFNLLFPFALVGVPVAQCNIGAIYQMGLGIECNATEAVKWLEAAGQQGCAVAYVNLSTIYSGTLPEIPYDKQKVREYGRKAIELGFDMIPSYWLDES